MKRPKVVVDRTRWCRGGTAANSSLQRPEDGRRCCLGFACLQLTGVAEEKIIGRGAPASAGIKELGPWRPDRGTRDRDLMNLAMVINDAPVDHTTYIHSCLLPAHMILAEKLGVSIRHIADDRDREDRLTKIFNEAGLDIEFTGAVEAQS